MHILTNTQGTLDVVFDAGYADGAVTVTVTNAAGGQVTTGAATKDNTTPGRYTFALAPQTAVASLTATWAGAWGGVAQSVEIYAEIVATQLFTIQQLRDFDDQKLAATVYTDEQLAEKRDEIHDFFERVCNVSFVRRYARDVLKGEWRRDIYLMRRRPQKILSVTVDDLALSSDDVALLTTYDSGKLERPTLWPYRPVQPRNIVVEYEYGWQQPPAKIVEAAKVLARYEIVARDVGDRTISVNTELGQVRLSVPGQNYPTGIPVVDAALAQYDESSTLEAF